MIDRHLDRLAGRESSAKPGEFFKNIKITFELLDNPDGIW